MQPRLSPLDGGPVLTMVTREPVMTVLFRMLFSWELRRKPAPTLIKLSTDETTVRESAHLGDNLLLINTAVCGIWLRIRATKCEVSSQSHLHAM